MKTLLIATTNQGKIKECLTILNRVDLRLVAMHEVVLESEYLPSEKETGSTLKENAIIKARYYAKKTNLLTLADDSGLLVDALDRKPGVHSQRYGQTQAERNQKVLTNLKGITDQKRTAKFVSVIAIYDPKLDHIETFQGEVSGRITQKPLGSNGFGYDPIFYSDELKKTFGQATKKEKNSISHRSRALEKTIAYLTTLN